MAGKMLPDFYIMYIACTVYVGPIPIPYKSQILFLKNKKTLIFSPKAISSDDTSKRFFTCQCPPKVIAYWFCVDSESLITIGWGDAKIGSAKQRYYRKRLILSDTSNPGKSIMVPGDIWVHKSAKCTCTSEPDYNMLDLDNMKNYFTILASNTTVVQIVNPTDSQTSVNLVKGVTKFRMVLRVVPLELASFVRIFMTSAALPLLQKQVLLPEAFSSSVSVAVLEGALDLSSQCVRINIQPGWRDGNWSGELHRSAIDIMFYARSLSSKPLTSEPPHFNVILDRLRKGATSHFSCRPVTVQKIDARLITVFTVELVELQNQAVVRGTGIILPQISSTKKEDIEVICTVLVYSPLVAVARAWCTLFFYGSVIKHFSRKQLRQIIFIPPQDGELSLPGLIEVNMEVYFPVSGNISLLETNPRIDEPVYVRLEPAIPAIIHSISITDSTKVGLYQLVYRIRLHTNTTIIFVNCLIFDSMVHLYLDPPNAIAEVSTTCYTASFGAFFRFYWLCTVQRPHEWSIKDLDLIELNLKGNYSEYSTKEQYMMRWINLTDQYSVRVLTGLPPGKYVCFCRITTGSFMRQIHIKMSVYSSTLSVYFVKFPRGRYVYQIWLMLTWMVAMLTVFIVISGMQNHYKQISDLRRNYKGRLIYCGDMRRVYNSYFVDKSVVPIANMLIDLKTLYIKQKFSSMKDEMERLTVGHFHLKNLPVDEISETQESRLLTSMMNKLAAFKTYKEPKNLLVEDEENLLFSEIECNIERKSSTTNRASIYSKIKSFQTNIIQPNFTHRTWKNRISSKFLEVQTVGPKLNRESVFDIFKYRKKYNEGERNIERDQFTRITHYVPESKLPIENDPNIPELPTQRRQTILKLMPLGAQNDEAKTAIRKQDKTVTFLETGSSMIQKSETSLREDRRNSLLTLMFANAKKEKFQFGNIFG